MRMPGNKTKLVCIIGGASDRADIPTQMLIASMNVARLSFLHGDFDSHARTIKRLRDAEKQTARRLPTCVDLPGPKIRIGTEREQQHEC